MSENFPFDTPDEFLNHQTSTNAEVPTVTIHSPNMPSITNSQRASLGGLLIVAANLFSDSSDTIKLASIVGITLVACTLIIGDALIRRSRNERIMSENTQTIQSSAEIAMHNAE